MTARRTPADMVMVAETSVPPLAADQSPAYDVRLEDLLQGQQEVMDLVLGNASLEDVLNRIVAVVEAAFAPAVCAISLFQRGDGALQHRIAPNLPAGLLAPGAVGNDYLFDPTATSVLSGERIVVGDFSVDKRWPEHATGVLANGLRSCWVEPIPDCGEGLFGITTLYYPEPREPDAGDERILWTLTSFIGFVISAAQREAQVRAANERFAALVSAIPGVVYQRVVKPDGEIRYTYISEGARDLFGVAPEEILADPEALFKTHSPDYKAKFRQRLLAASRALTMWDVEATLVRPDGAKRYTHAIARPNRQDDGAVVWTGVILDETRTREALIDSLSQGFVLFDAQDRLVMRNGHYVTLYPALRGVAVPGATYEEVVKFETACVPDMPDTELRAQYSERLEQHHKSQTVFERKLDDTRWILVSEQRTRDGGTVVLYTDITTLKNREKQIQHLSLHDGLTGLPNRMMFNQRVEQALARAGKRGLSVAVMCLDVDHFKNVNDSLGHVAGDALLKSIGERARECLREGDTVARLGSDEFGIVVASADAFEHATQVASRLLTELGRPMEFNGNQVVSGISIGIATSSGEEEGAEQLIKNADLALNRAKTDGRGTFRFFEAEMDARVLARSALEVDLRQALTKNQFVLHYQPEVDIETHEIVGFEALVRWRHPDLGLVAPSEFIPLAEETGVIMRLGEWVLRQACLDAKRWPDSVRVSVNVSPAQFRNPGLAQLVAEVLDQTTLPPERLELEITESLLLRDIDGNLGTLEKLKALGIRVAMDDFGTGYSSLGNLRSFPFDKLKIDRSFIGDVETNPDSLAIVKAVLGLGRSLGMATCAEGVESEEQVRRLRAEGCDEAQGYYYSQPKPIEGTRDLLRKGFPAPPGDLTFID